MKIDIYWFQMHLNNSIRSKHSCLSVPTGYLISMWLQILLICAKMPMTGGKLDSQKADELLSLKEFEKTRPKGLVNKKNIYSSWWVEFNFRVAIFYSWTCVSMRFSSNIHTTILCRYSLKILWKCTKVIMPS